MIDEPQNPKCRTEFIVSLLTCYVRVVSDRQLVRLSQATPRAIGQLVHRLEADGLVTTRVVIVHPELDLQAPLYYWQPDSQPPQFDRLAWQLRSRWKERPQKCRIAAATEKARRVSGGHFGGRPLRRTEICHDLHVTALFFKLCRDTPTDIPLWIHEDQLVREAGSQPAEKIPDAMIGGKAIDFGGRYRAAKLREIHRAHAIRQMPYEIW